MYHSCVSVSSCVAAHFSPQFQEVIQGARIMQETKKKDVVRCQALSLSPVFIVCPIKASNYLCEISLKRLFCLCCSVTFQRVQRTFLDTSFHCRLTQVTLRYRGWRWCTTYSIRRLLVEEDLSSSRIVFYF